MMTKTDYLIVGQGLAGTFFAHELVKHGRDFIVIDPDTHNASKTAAGMYNPVVLKRFTPVWQGKEQILTARQSLAELESELNVTLDYPFPVLRIFHQANEQQTWEAKALKPSLMALLDSRLLASPDAKIQAPYGVGRVNFSGRADLTALLAGYRQQLIRQQKIRTQTLDYDALNIHPHQVVYQDIVANKVVFCEGYGIKHNPYFKHLPLKGDKGEVLTVEIPDLQLDAALKSKAFIMPLKEKGKNIYFVGATYHHTDKNSLPTAAGKAELLDKLQQFVNADIKVLSQQAGIRPTVSDRRPLLGQHPKHPRLYVLNGLGTRGVMLGASMAKHLYDFIEKQKPLPHVVDISRFS